MHISNPEHTINRRLHRLYPPEIADRAVNSIIDLVFKYKQRISPQHYHLSEKDVILITYGDQVSQPQEHEASLQTLYGFLNDHLDGVINSVHILPFYPSSSDGGFSVVNYSRVEPHMGSWREIDMIASKYRLMVDGVINHVSKYSDWFTAFLAGDAYFRDFFIEVDPFTDLSDVVRPRSSPVLSEFTDYEGKIHNIWTTFSKDQVDLNYKNHRVLRNVLDALLYYVEKGATLIRLDAIAFVWKEIGTECVHLPQTHELIQLMREVIHEVAPEVIIITETNVPHHENISYFGSGDDEAQMVYNFALPPLLIHSVHTGDTRTLTRWAQSLELPSEKVCFFNFTSSHDGIGLRPVRGILRDEDIEAMIERVTGYGGLVSFRKSAEDTQEAYEMNSTFIDALTDPDASEQLRIKRLLLTQAVTLAMPGVPGIYFNSLIGTGNYHEGVKHSGSNRSINREKFNIDWLEQELVTEGSMAKCVFQSYRRLISIRISEGAFNPFGHFEVLDLGKELFVIDQICQECQGRVLAVHNFSDKPVTFEIPEHITLPLSDLLSRNEISRERHVTIEPYQVAWYKGKIFPKYD